MCEVDHVEGDFVGVDGFHEVFDGVVEGFFEGVVGDGEFVDEERDDDVAFDFGEVVFGVFCGVDEDLKEFEEGFCEGGVLVVVDFLAEDF